MVGHTAVIEAYGGIHALSEYVPQPIGDFELRALVRRLLHEEFAKIHPLWVERELVLLTSLRKIFGNDLDKPIILGVIGQFMFQNMAGASSRYEDHLSGIQPVVPARLTNIESIATSTGIPRESVRRKIGEMIEAGWLTRDSKGGLFVTAKAANELDGATQHIFRLLADMYELISATLAARDEAVLVKPASRDHKADPA